MKTMNKLYIMDSLFYKQCYKICNPDKDNCNFPLQLLADILSNSLTYSKLKLNKDTHSNYLLLYEANE